jgi:hypothetical protein
VALRQGVARMARLLSKHLGDDEDEHCATDPSTEEEIKERVADGENRRGSDEGGKHGGLL